VITLSESEQEFSGLNPPVPGASTFCSQPSSRFLHRISWLFRRRRCNAEQARQSLPTLHPFPPLLTRSTPQFSPRRDGSYNVNTTFPTSQKTHSARWFNSRLVESNSIEHTVKCRHSRHRCLHPKPTCSARLAQRTPSTTINILQLHSFDSPARCYHCPRPDTKSHLQSSHSIGTSRRSTRYQREWETTTPSTLPLHLAHPLLIPRSPFTCTHSVHFRRPREHFCSSPTERIHSRPRTVPISLPRSFTLYIPPNDASRNLCPSTSIHRSKGIEVPRIALTARSA
jgi:hypothetical protein